MVSIKPKTLVTLSVDSQSVSHSDDSTGPSPVEMMLTSLCACADIIIHRLCDKHDVVFDDVKVRAEADFDRRGVILQEEIDIPFRAVRVFIDMKSNSPAHKLDPVKEGLPKFCPVLKTISQSGSKVEEIWTISAA